MKNPKKAIEFLKSYRWSSHPDYCGIKNFPSVTQREFLSEFFGGETGYKKSFEAWVRNMDCSAIDDKTALEPLEPI